MAQISDDRWGPRQFADLADLVSAVTSHNAPMRLVSSITNFQEAGQGEESARQALTDIEAIFQTHSRTLQKLGLALKPVSISLLEGGESVSEQIDVEIFDARKFEAGIRSVRQSDLSDGKCVDALCGIFGLLEPQFLQRNLADGNGPEGTEEMNAALRGGIRHLRSLGLGDELAHIDELMDAQEQGFLAELRYIKMLRLDRAVGDAFGPSTWHLGTIPSFYAQWWQDAVDALDVLVDAPHCRDLFIRMKQHLLDSIDFAERDIQRRPVSADGDCSPAKRREFLEVLQKSKAKIEILGE